MAVGGSGSPQLVSERPGLHLSRSVPVDRDHGRDGGDGETFRPLLCQSLEILSQTLADTVLLIINGWYERSGGLLQLSRNASSSWLGGQGFRAA